MRRHSGDRPRTVRRGSFRHADLGNHGRSGRRSDRLARGRWKRCGRSCISTASSCTCAAPMGRSRDTRFRRVRRGGGRPQGAARLWLGRVGTEFWLSSLTDLKSSWTAQHLHRLHRRPVGVRRSDPRGVSQGRGATLHSSAWSVAVTFVRRTASGDRRSEVSLSERRRSSTQRRVKLCSGLGRGVSATIARAIAHNWTNIVALLVFPPPIHQPISTTNASSFNSVNPQIHAEPQTCPTRHRP